MAAAYPYVSNDRLFGGSLTLDIGSSPGVLPPSSPSGNSQIGKFWVDTTTTPYTLRICAQTETSAAYDAADWFTICTIPAGGQSLAVEYVPKNGDSTITGTLNVSGALDVGGNILAGASTNGGLYFKDATSGRLWGWFGSGDKAALNNGSGAPFTIDPVGSVAMGGNLTVAGSSTFDNDVNLLGNNLGVHSKAIFFGEVDVQVGPVNMVGNVGVTGNLTVNTGPLTVNGNMSALFIDATHIQLEGTGTSVVNVPNGNISTGHSVSCLDLVVGNGATINGTGAIALNIPNGGLTAGTVTGGSLVAGGTGAVIVAASGDLHCQNAVTTNDIAANGVFRRNLPIGSPKGARIECFGGDWGSVQFAMVSGALYASTDGSTGFFYNNAGSFSDARLKDNIRDSEVDALELLRQTPVRAFEWNAEGVELMPYAVPMDCGLVAQELAETMPIAVGKAGLGSDTLFINHQYLTPYLIRAIQQLADRLDAGGL